MTQKKLIPLCLHSQPLPVLLWTLSFNIRPRLPQDVFTVFAAWVGCLSLRDFQAVYVAVCHVTPQLPWQIFVFHEKRGLKKKINVNGQIPRQTGLQANVWPSPSLFLSQLF